MDDRSKEKEDADPRRSIAAFLEAARQEGLLADTVAETLGRFHQRLLSPPPVARPTDTGRRIEERRAAERLIRDLGTTRRRVSSRSRDRALLSAAIAATTQALGEESQRTIMVLVFPGLVTL